MTEVIQWVVGIAFLIGLIWHHEHNRAMHFIVVAVYWMFLLTGCAYYPEAKDMDILVRVHDDLTDVCGSVTAKGCAYTVGDTCFVHVGERAGYTLEHELSHCFGRRDAP